MSKVKFNQSGYIGCSMSERAAIAYECGEKPWSKWDKCSMIHCLPQHLQTEKIKCYSTEVLRNVFLKYSSWHHVGKYANEVRFFSMDEDLLEKSEQEIVDLLNVEKEYLKTTRIQNKNFKSVSMLQKCKFCYETVEGTRRRFKFVENYEYGIMVDGWIYYSTYYGVKKKKLGGKHVWIVEEYTRAPNGTAEIFKKILKGMPSNKKKFKYN